MYSSPSIFKGLTMDSSRISWNFFPEAYCSKIGESKIDINIVDVREKNYNLETCISFMLKQ